MAAFLFPTQFWAGRLIDASRRNWENLHFPLTWTKRWQFLWSICVTASYFSSEYLYIKHARTAYVVFAFGKRKISSITSPMGKREVPNRQIASVIDYCLDNQPSIISWEFALSSFPRKHDSLFHYAWEANSEMPREPVYSCKFIEVLYNLRIFFCRASGVFQAQDFPSIFTPLDWPFAFPTFSFHNRNN